MNQKTEEFYIRLQEELTKANSWPAPYLFKFIMPTNEASIAAAEKAFDYMGAVINKNQSKNGKYTSLSINLIMPSPESIIQKYQELSSIEGIISL